MNFNVKDFGALGNGTADDHHAFQKALDAMKTRRSLGYVHGGGILLVPEGNYFLSRTLWIDHRVEIRGITGPEGMSAYNMGFTAGMPREPQPKGISRLLFPRGVTGIRVAMGGPYAGGSDPDYMEMATGTILKNLVITAEDLPAIPEPVLSPAGYAHGIVIKTRTTIENCLITNFSGNGIHIVAPSGIQPFFEGYAAVDTYNTDGVDYSLFNDRIREANYNSIQNGDLIAGCLIDDDSTQDDRPFIDIKHPELGDLLRENMYVVAIKHLLTGEIRYQLVRQLANAINTKVSSTVCAFNSMNGVYVAGSNSGNMLFEQVYCHHNGRYGFFDSESSGANTYLNCQSDYNTKGGFWRLFTLAVLNKTKLTDRLEYSNASDAQHAYISCYQEGNGEFEAGSLKDPAPSKIHPGAIIIGGNIHAAQPDPDPLRGNMYQGNDVEEDPEFRDNYISLSVPATLPGTLISAEAFPALFVKGFPYTGAGFPYGLSADVADKKIDAFRYEKGTKVELGGAREGHAITLYPRGTGEHQKLVYSDNWWHMQQWNGGDAFAFSTADAPETAAQFWLPNGCYIGQSIAGTRRKIEIFSYDTLPDPNDPKINTGDIVLNSQPVLNDSKRGFAGFICITDPVNPPAKTWAGYGKIELLT